MNRPSQARPSALAHAAYTALLRLIAPLVLARWWWRGRREPLYRRALAERFGLYGGRPTEPGRLWLHAVSLGETRAASALIEALRRERAGLRILLTHGTATGREAGAALLHEGDAQAWLPYDTPGAVRRFIAHWQPVAGVLMETEVWPGLMCGAQAAGLPMVLANARLSERSLRRGQRFAALLRPAFAALSRVLAQTEADALRLREAGASQVEVLGNLKFDLNPDAAALARGHAWSRAAPRPLVIAASTREGEEAALLDVWSPQASTAPPASAAAPRLLLVPRHPQRFDEVAALVARAGLSLSRRSLWPHGQPDADALAAEVWLGDSVGEMPAYYAAARVALLGGSFAPLGGQNLIEAAACGCPVLMGPHTFNFADAALGLIAVGAGQRVAGWGEAVSRAQELCAHDARRLAMSERGLAFAQAHRGAARAMARVILEVSPAVA